ncbi:hypothetical protein [Mycolicibacterium austroafricanum]|uniref:hypothetical protein n=1 Tax=Mycolicibacterium austroafricanum TaxID=39687 RepID=UPI0005615452|nr:hypothetical protein [Mycolicibacterium austroafricanum]
MSDDTGVDPSDYADPSIPEMSEAVFDAYFEREARYGADYRARTSYLKEHVGWECAAVASLTEIASSAQLEKSIGWPDLIQVAMIIAECTHLPEKVYDSDAFLGFIVRKLYEVQRQHRSVPAGPCTGDFPWHCNGDFALEVVGWISESGMFGSRDVLEPAAPPSPTPLHGGHTDSSESNGDSCPR